VTVPGGCRSQGCHGYPTCSTQLLLAPPFFQAPSPSSSIVDEFKFYYIFLIQEVRLAAESNCTASVSNKVIYLLVNDIWQPNPSVGV